MFNCNIEKVEMRFSDSACQNACDTLDFLLAMPKTIIYITTKYAECQLTSRHTPKTENLSKCSCLFQPTSSYVYASFYKEWEED
jgi:hypothetical protein